MAAGLRSLDEGGPAVPARPATQSVDRALAVLGFFSATEPELSSAEIAVRLGLHQTTAYRLLSTLEASGYVMRDSRTGLYRLGLRLVELAGFVLNRTDLYRHALPELHSLRDSLDLSANLAVLESGDVFHLAHATRAGVPPAYAVPGRRAVAHCTALGKVLLAAEPRLRVHADIERRGWRPRTEHSLAGFSALDRCLDDVAARGYAVDMEEYKLDQLCVAAPCSDRSATVVGAVSVSGPRTRIVGLPLERVVNEVRAAAARISSRLGHVEAWWSSC
jgi:DNA-binding IclR family transcriptional regulator